MKYIIYIAIFLLLVACSESSSSNNNAGGDRENPPPKAPPITTPQDNPIFTKRVNASVVVFKNNLWVIGGIDGTEDNSCKSATSQFCNDVWKSTNGKNWDLITSSADFSPRVASDLISYNNKLILFNNLYSNNVDIWNSSNGINWQEITTDTIFPVVVKFSIIENKITTLLNNIIYQSTNAKDWIEITTDIKDNSISSSLTKIEIQNSTYFLQNDNIFITSDNLKNWKINNNTLDLKYYKIIRNNQQNYIIGGYTEYISDCFFCNVSNRIYTTTNILNLDSWQEINFNIQFSKRDGYNQILFKNKIFVIGGYLENKTLTNEVWSWSMDENEGWIKER